MRYLRMLTNAALGGAFGAAFVAVIFLQLNPELPLVPSVVVPLYAVIFLFYGTQHLARDVKAVHADVTALLMAGVIDRTQTGQIEFPYDAVKVEFVLEAA